MHPALIPPFRASNKTVGQAEAQVLHWPRTGSLDEYRYAVRIGCAGA